MAEPKSVGSFYAAESDHRRIEQWAEATAQRRAKTSKSTVVVHALHQLWTAVQRDHTTDFALDVAAALGGRAGVVMQNGHLVLGTVGQDQAFEPEWDFREGEWETSYRGKSRRWALRPTVTSAPDLQSGESEVTVGAIIEGCSNPLGLPAYVWLRSGVGMDPDDPLPLPVPTAEFPDRVRLANRDGHRLDDHVLDGLPEDTA